MEQLLRYFPDLTAQQQLQFEALLPLYRDWNERINVISRKDVDNLYERHVLHSLAVAKVCDFKAGSRILDIGTGGGFPLIPLAILFPEVNFTGLDGIHKKIRVVNEIAQALALKNVIAKAERAEQGPRWYFDFVTCRAVTTIDKLVAWTDPLLKRDNKNTIKNGLIALKGGDLTEELLLLENRKHQIFPLQTWYESEFFEWKSMVYVPL